MTVGQLKVMIIGAGTGGLCLAQGLKSDGVSVEVFERDHSPTDRLQGYRLSIDKNGARALRACLPSALFQKLVSTSAKPSRGVTFLDHHLHRLLAVDLPRPAGPAVESELPVSRIALRQVLLQGLEPTVRFGKRFISYDDAPGNSINVHFADGTAATGDALIGADGASSHVREQLVPSARRVATGIFAVSGKFALTPESLVATPEVIFRGPTLILGPRGCFLFASAVEYPVGNQHASQTTDGLHDHDEYVMWGFSTRRERFRLPQNLDSLSGEDWKQSVLAQMRDWHPALRGMVQRADVSTISPFDVKTSVPIPPWPTRNVTLLGDALHNMTPFRGIGANTALRDAAALRRALTSVARGQAELIPALASYERNMIDYGFRAVRASLKQMDRFHADKPLARGFTKALFRTVDLLPPLKLAFLSDH